MDTLATLAELPATAADTSIDTVLPTSAPAPAAMAYLLDADSEGVVSALDLIVQIERMRDGTRRVTELSEVVGMEQDVITLGTLFAFKYEGQNPDGTVSGRFEATGIRPRFLPRLEYYGLDATFMKAVSATRTAA